MQTPTDDQPLRLLDPLLVGLRVLELAERRIHRVVDFLLGAVADEHRAAAPLDDDDLALGDRRQVDFDRRQRERRRVGVHLIDQWPGDGGGADRADRRGGDVEEVPTVGIFDGRARQMYPQIVAPEVRRESTRVPLGRVGSTETSAAEASSLGRACKKRPKRSGLFRIVRQGCP